MPLVTRFGVLFVVSQVTQNLIYFCLGPVDTDSVDELAINSDSETSEAPDFEHPSPAKNMYSLSNTSLDAVKDAGKERRSIAEAGRDKIVISQATSKCKLIGRDFPSSEHILSQQELELVS